MGYTLGDHMQNMGDGFSWLMNSSKTGVGTKDPVRKNNTGPTPRQQESIAETMQELRSSMNSWLTSAHARPRIGDRKPGPWDEGYVKPNTTMEPENKATLSEYLNPGPRQDTRTNGNGIVQDGLKMSGGVSAAFVPEYANSSFNDLLSRVNNQQFSSNQLPTTAGSPDAAVSPKTQAITNIGPVADGQEYANNLGRQGTSGIGPVADGQVYGNTLENAPGAGTAGIGPLADGGAYARALGKGGGSTSRLDAALSDTAGMQSYMSKFSSGDRERAANRAFLDTEGSMKGLRAKEAVNGVVYAGGQLYMSGESGDDKAIAINRGQAHDISNGKSTAAGLLETYKSRITGAQKDTPAESQDPLSVAGSAVKSGFAAGAQTDFALNNNQGTPQVGIGPVVPTDQIPKDLSGAAGKKYLADLDAGRLFN